MATLVRERPTNPFTEAAAVAEVDGNVPAPFPVLERTQGRRRDISHDLLDEISPQDVAGAVPVSHAAATAPKLETTQQHGNVEQDLLSDTAHPHTAGAVPVTQETTATAADLVQLQQQRDMLSSMVQVKHSCILTLNGLLSGPTEEWQPIVTTTRRHSMPSALHSDGPSSPVGQTSDSTVSALQTLVSNLRSHDPLDGMVQISSANEEAPLVHELQRRVDVRLPTLSPHDAQLARSLVSVLAHLARLSQLAGHQDLAHESPVSAQIDGSIYDTLQRQVCDFQSRRLDQPTTSEPSPPTTAVETALLWSRIDADLDTVLRLSRERQAPARAWSPMPPEYEHPDDDELEDYDFPPEYKYDDTKSVRSVKARRSSVTGSATLTDEKRRMDLESVALAIDRLYLVAPQLHNQRVELKKAKLDQMERAQSAGPSTSTVPTPTHVMSDKRRQKMRADAEPDPRELDQLLGMIGRASARKMSDQVVVMDEDMQARMDRARKTNDASREAFVAQLVQASGAGRMHAQSAVLSLPRVKDPHAMLSLPEFIREPLPAVIVEQDLNNPETLLTLPEFVRESALQALKTEKQHFPEASSSRISDAAATQAGKTTTFRRLQQTLTRSRSLSAPPLAWLNAAGNKSPHQVASPPPETKPDVPALAGLTVSYIAEYQEALQTLYAFLRVDGIIPGHKVEAKVIASGSSNGIERLLLKCGPNWSRPLRLPVHVKTGSQEVRHQGNHYEINLPVVTAERPAPLEAKAMLDVEQILALGPTSFVCNSCSLPLVQASKITRWNDLPSEHWAELLDAWMCHNDQKLTDQARKAAHGFWPVEGQAMVGGSYILFDESAVVPANVVSSAAPSLSHISDDWKIVRCLCGAVIGRCQPSKNAAEQSPFDDQPPPDPPTTYRFAKYALRPTVPSNYIIRMPLSAYIVQDMHELAQAHAIWRFIVLDEEEEKPRLLLWMLKPHMLVSYETAKHYLMPPCATTHVAKILFKLVKPSIPVPDVKSLIEQHPHFQQHEQLMYPFQVCQQIAALLQESNSVYPEHTQQLLGLRVGWLQRA